MVGLWILLAIAVGVGTCLAAAPHAAAWLASWRARRRAHAAAAAAARQAAGGSRAALDRSSQAASELKWVESKGEFGGSCGVECSLTPPVDKLAAEPGSAALAPPLQQPAGQLGAEAGEEDAAAAAAAEARLAALQDARHIAEATAARLQELLRRAGA